MPIDWQFAENMINLGGTGRKKIEPADGLRQQETARAILDVLRTQPGVNQIPVVILTTSSSERHVTKLYTAGRCRYLVKTSDLSGISAIAAEIHAFGLACRPT